jgi:hypothetical protein
VEYEHLAPVGILVDVLPMDFKVAEHGAVELPEHLVVITRDKNDFGAALRLAENGAQHVIVGLRPKHGFLHAPDVHDVTYQE